MATKKIKTTELYVYDLTHRFQLTPLTDTVAVTPTELSDATLQIHNQNEDAATTNNGAGSCHYCGSIPQDPVDPDYLRNHYRRDYHRYNIKRSFQHQPPLAEDEFERLVGELDESISGSDSDGSGSDSEDKTNKIEALMRKTNLEDIPEDIDDKSSHSTQNNHNTPYFLYTTPQLPQDKALAVYKAVLDTKFTAPKGDSVAPLAERMTGSLEALDAAGTSAIFMIGGGHFSGAIISHQRLRQIPTSTNPYADVQILAHKSFHRYTTRRKQGGSQSASDNARGKANSAGSSLRRYNEAALEKEVRELLVEWATPYLSKTSAIYVRANGRANRAVLMSFAGSPISASDPRVKTLPFTTRRATATEIKRAWWELSHAKIINKPKEESRKPAQTSSTPTVSSKPAEQKESPNDVHTRELTAFIRRSKIPSLLAYLKKNKLNAATFRLSPADTPEYAAAPTLLHYAAARGAQSMIVPLLKTLKADPTVQNAAGRTAAQVAADNATFGAFCVARAAMGEKGQPGVTWDWDTDAHVGAAVSKEEQRAQDAREAEAREKARAAEAAANRDILEQAQRKEVERIQKEKKAAEARIAANSHTLGGGTGAGLTGLSTSSTTLLELTPEDRRRFEREQRARAIEARLKKN